MLYFISMDKILLLITFLTPLSVNLVFNEFNLGISIPAEPLMAGVLIIVLLRLFNGYTFDRKMMSHPLVIAVLFNIGWIFITTLTSELPVVSVKFLIARLWFVVPFFFAGVLLFSDIKNVRRFTWLYVLALSVVIIYTTYRHTIYGFAEKAGNWVMRPFYNDHTAYGAALALFIPFAIAFLVNKKYSFAKRMLAFIILILLLTGLFLSFSRAAWISMVAGILVFLILKLGIRFRYVATALGMILIMMFSFQHQILEFLERNRQDSSTNFVEHIQSIYNIRTDASNLERINRWQAGIRLFHERPVVGWGPGTYQFVYGPYQRSKEKTIISTNLGDMGNAHSEYIGPLSEQGLPGLISIVSVILIAFHTAIKVRRRTSDPEVKLFVTAATIGLVTYFTHGFLNNFLDTDKASVPVWGFMAMILAFDLYYPKRELPEKGDNSQS